MYEIVLIVVDPVLENNSWKQISTISATGNAKNIWKIGDTKKVVLQNAPYKGNTYDAFIVDFPNRIWFQIGKYFGRDFALFQNTPDYAYNFIQGTPQGGWGSSALRETCKKIINYLPSELKKYLHNETIWSDNNSIQGEFHASVTTDKLFVLAIYEATGARIAMSSQEYQHQRYCDYYKAGNSRVAFSSESSTTKIQWLTRTPNTISSTYNSCWVVNENGEDMAQFVTYDCGIRPVFSI